MSRAAYAAAGTSHPPARPRRPRGSGGPTSPPCARLHHIHRPRLGAASRRTGRAADADEATRELIHDHEHPVAPEHDGLASKEVHAPQAVCRVADERQPRGPGAARGGAIVFRQHAAHDVLIDVGPERSRDDARNPWTANRGFRDLISTMTWISASLGPFGPGFFGHSLDENSRRYVRRTNA